MWNLKGKKRQKWIYFQKRKTVTDTETKHGYKSGVGGGMN